MKDIILAWALAHVTALLIKLWAKCSETVRVETSVVIFKAITSTFYPALIKQGLIVAMDPKEAPDEDDTRH